MAISVPTSCAVTDYSGQTSTTVITPTTNLAAGTLAVLLMHSNGGKTASSVADSKGNTWTVHTSGSDGTRAHSIASAQIGTAVLTSDTVTITWSSSSSATPSIHLVTMTGCATSSAFDATATNTESSGGGTTRTSGNTATLAQANEICFGLCTSNLSSTSATAGSGFSGLTQLKTNFVFSEYQIVAATTALAATFTSMVNTSITRTTIATFKGAAAVKTVDGLARASVKTVDGLALASVKTMDGLLA